MVTSVSGAGKANQGDWSFTFFMPELNDSCVEDTSFTLGARAMGGIRCKLRPGLLGSESALTLLAVSTASVLPPPL